MSRTAIVIGGSVAGLFSAKALARHFDHVSIIERDTYPDDPVFRDGTPQAHHGHMMLAGGQEALDTYFPNIRKQMIQEGIQEIMWGRDAALMLPGSGWMPRVVTDSISFSCSRPRIEFMMHQSMIHDPKFTFHLNTSCTSLIMDGDKVIGVNIQDKATKIHDVIHADLVVDASGRSSRTPEWLESMNYSAPKETIVNAYLGYATRWYQESENFQADWRLMYILPNPKTGNNRALLIMRLENGLRSVVVYGANRDYPPTDEAGFEAYIKSINAPEEIMKHAEPITPIYGYRRTENCLRHYHELKHRPENFIVIGDAVCGFNPVYGQGMSIAGRGAITLDKLLSERNLGKGFARTFQKRLYSALMGAWIMSTGADLAYPGTEGTPPNFITRNIQNYLNYIQESLFGTDEDYAATFNRVLNLKIHPASLLHPRFLLKSLRVNRYKVVRQKMVENPV